MSRRAYVVLGFVLLMPACEGNPSRATSPEPQPVPSSAGTVTALVDDSTWTSGFVTVTHGNGSMYITAIGWEGDTRHYLRLILQTAAGSTPQVIGPDKPALAGLSIEFVGGWVASGDFGNGTITLDSLTTARAIGSFTFTGVTSDPVTPRARVVKNGRFAVNLR